MGRRILSWFALIIVAVILVSSAVQAQEQQSSAPQSTVSITNSAGQTVDIPIEIADTPAERETGLMGRTALAADAGMLFVFDQDQPLSFWMKTLQYRSP